MRKQVILIHGGNAYDTYQEYISDLKKCPVDREDFKSEDKNKWKENLGIDLGSDFELFYPEMPGKRWNGKYSEWKIWFERLLRFVDKGAVFVGHSLGGIFLAKYFSENKDTKKSAGIFLIAAPFCNTNKEKMADFILPKKLTKLNDLGDRLHLYHSKDDPLVKFADFKKYVTFLPKAQIKIFKDRGHFRQEKFPELVKDIKNLYK
ncbi:MAG: alpha/beta hydrolase [Candidatus Paceibacterota bacterium]